MSRRRVHHRPISALVVAAVLLVACSDDDASPTSIAPATGSTSTAVASAPPATETPTSTTPDSTVPSSAPGDPDPEPGVEGPPMRLPEPTGDEATGTALIPVELDMADPLNPDADTRQLMIQLWYPTDDTSAAVAPYAPPQEAEALQLFYALPPGAFAAETHSHIDAPVSGGMRPVVFFHHGLCASRTDSTIVAEELASHGYVVVAFGSTGESAAVEFPDGRVVEPLDADYCNAGGAPFSEAGQATLNELLAVRVADVVAVADLLTRVSDADAGGLAVPEGLAEAIEVSQFGIYGHSFGGATAAAVIAADDRFVGGVNLDGFIIGPVSTEGLDRPFLSIGSSYHDPSFDPSWATFLPALRGWHAWWMLDGAGHYRFIDIGGSVEQWGLTDTLRTQDPTTWEQVFGDVGDAESQDAVRAAVVGFFDEFLAEDGDLAAVPGDHPRLVDRTDEIGA